MRERFSNLDKGTDRRTSNRNNVNTGAALPKQTLVLFDTKQADITKKQTSSSRYSKGSDKSLSQLPLRAERAESLKYGKLKANAENRGAIEKSVNTGHNVLQPHSDDLRKTSSTRHETAKSAAVQSSKATTYLSRMSREELIEVATSQKDDIAKLQNLLNQTTAAAAAASAAAAAAAAASRNSNRSEDVNPIQGRFQRTFVVDNDVTSDNLVFVAEGGGIAELGSRPSYPESDTGDSPFFIGRSGTDSEGSSIFIDDTHSRLQRKRERCHVQIQTRIPSSNVSIQVGQLEVTNTHDVSVLVSHCTSKIVQVLQRLHDIALVKLSSIDSDLDGISSAREFSMHTEIKCGMRSILKEISSLQFIFEEELSKLQAEGLFSEVQKHIFGLHVKYPKDVIDSVLNKIEQKMVILVAPKFHMHGKRKHHSNARSVVAALQSTSNLVKGKLIKLQTHFMTSLHDIIGNVTKICENIIDRSMSALKDVISCVTLAVNDMKLLKFRTNVSEYRLNKISMALKAADSTISGLLIAVKQSLIFATWVAASEGKDVATELLEVVMTSKAKLLHGMSVTSDIITSMLVNADPSAINGLAYISCEGKNVISKIEEILFGIHVDIVTTGEGHVSGIITATSEGGRLLCLELQTSSHSISSMLQNMCRDDAAWLCTNSSITSAVTSELDTLKLIIRRCELRGRRIMMIIAKILQKSFFHPKIQILEYESKRDFPSIHTSNRIDQNQDLSQNFDNSQVGSSLNDRTRILLVNSFKELFTTVSDATLFLENNIDSHCKHLLSSKGSLCSSLEEGLKSIQRMIKIVKRKYVESTQSFLEHIQMIVEKKGEIVVARRLPPLFPTLCTTSETSNNNNFQDAHESQNYDSARFAKAPEKEVIQDTVQENQIGTKSQISARDIELQNIFDSDE